MSLIRLMRGASAVFGFAFVVAVAVAIAPHSVLAQAQTLKLEDQLRLIFVPCANHGLGEWVELDLTAHFVDYDPSQSGAELAHWSDAKGIGRITGKDYVASRSVNRVDGSDQYRHRLNINSGGEDGASYSASWIGLLSDIPTEFISERCNDRSPPNILFIIADDLGAEATSVYSALAGDIPQAPMPTIDGLAAGGIVFDNVWVNPVCSPMRSEVVTGLYGHKTGVLYPGTPMPTDIPALFKIIRDQSQHEYDIGVFGKWHLAPESGDIQQRSNMLAAHLIESGVDEFQGHLGGGVPNYFDWITVDENAIWSQTNEYTTTAITNYAIDFIEDHRTNQPDEPWFAYVAYNAPHGVFASNGFQVPPDNLHSYDWGSVDEPPIDPMRNEPLLVQDNGTPRVLQAGDVFDSILVYQAMVEALDTEIGRLLDTVGPPGSKERDETIVIFMGDNGTPLIVKDPGSAVLGSKTQVAEGGVRVPLIVSSAMLGRQGVRDDALIDATDMFATIADLAGVQVIPDRDGYSIKPRFGLPRFPWLAVAPTGRSHAFAETCFNQFNVLPINRFAIRDERYKLSYNSNERVESPFFLDQTLLGGSRAPWVDEVVPAGWGLFDLQNDIGESENLYNDVTAPAEAMQAQADLMAELQNLSAAAPYGCFVQP